MVKRLVKLLLKRIYNIVERDIIYKTYSLILEKKQRKVFEEVTGNPVPGAGQEQPAREQTVTVDSQTGRVVEEVTGNPVPGAGQEQPAREQTVTVDSQTGRVFEGKRAEREIESQSFLIVQKQLPPHLPADIVKLAAQNKAFFQGILALQRMSLDEDLFIEAIEDLKKKYYRERDKV